MYGSGITPGDVAFAVDFANHDYGGNLTLDRNEWKGKRVAFKLNVASSFDKGARRSYTGRRMKAACWHAHRDVLKWLFEAHPDAVVRTSLAVYSGKAGFESMFHATGRRNIGSQFNPCNYADACDCIDHWDGVPS